MNIILIPLIVALVACVYSVILTEPLQLFAPLRQFLEDCLLREKYWQNRFPERYPHGDPVYRFGFRVYNHYWLYYPLIGCEKCVCGQWMFWYYILFYPESYNWQHHVFMVAIAIYYVCIIKRIYLWTQTTPN